MPAGTRAPDRVIMAIFGLHPREAQWLALLATGYARRHAPKLTGISARGIVPVFGRGFFGVSWSEDRVWFQNAGVNPFVMRSLAGKTIPLWIDDPTGEETRKAKEKAKDPSKVQTRTTESGRTQVLIFRRAAQMGARKTVTRKSGGISQQVSVPQSYPGAPGRIALREAGAPYTTQGRTGGRIARGNVGLRWYFPGLSPRNFLQNGLIEACNTVGIIPGAIHLGYGFIPTTGNQIPAYPRQPMAERMGMMARGGVPRT